MNKFFLITIFTFFIACQPAQDKPTFDKMNTFPFELKGDNKLVVECEGAAYKTHNPIFEKHEFSGNGYSWEGVIRHILNEKNPELLTHMDFDPEAGSFLARVDTAENRQRIVEVLLPICSDLEKFDAYLSKIDPEEMDD